MTCSRSEMRRYVSVGLRLVVGAVLLYAAYSKLRQPWLVFAMSIDAYGLLPEWAVLFAARTLPWAELVLAVLIVKGCGLRYAALAATTLLAVFFAVMVYSYQRGLSIDCGCFGLGDTLGFRTLFRDGVLLAASVVLTVLAFLPGASAVPAREISDLTTTGQ